jgi:chromosome segregation ATPase
MSETAYTDMEMDLMCATADARQWRERFDGLKKKYEELLYKHEELQNLFVETEEELDYYREKYVQEALKYDSIKTELLTINSRLSVVEDFISFANRSEG